MYSALLVFGTLTRNAIVSDIGIALVTLLLLLPYLLLLSDMQASTKF